jgi:hypothetical protein
MKIGSFKNKNNRVVGPCFQLENCSWIQGRKMFDHSDTLDGTLCCVGGSWMSLGTVLHADVMLIAGWAVANIKRVEGESK